MLTATRTIEVVETCIFCSRVVIVERNGKPIPTRADGYCGISAHGDPVCTDHWCPVCYGAHDCDDDFRACADEAATDRGCSDAFYESMTGR